MLFTVQQQFSRHDKLCERRKRTNGFDEDGKQEVILNKLGNMLREQVPLMFDGSVV